MRAVCVGAVLATAAPLPLQYYTMRRLLLIVLLSTLVAMGPNPSTDSGKPVNPWDIDKLEKSKAPEFTLKDIAGKPVALSTYKGKVILLNFWASWCPSCRAEMPSLNKIYGQMKARGFEVIAVSADRSVTDVKKFTDKSPLDFTSLIDETRDVTKQYKVFSLPTTFLIDRKGIIVEKFYGEYDWTEPEMRQKIEKLL